MVTREDDLSSSSPLGGNYFDTTINAFNNDDVTCGKALKSASFVLSKFSQIVNIETKLTTYWHKRGEQLRNE